MVETSARKLLNELFPKDYDVDARPGPDDGPLVVTVTPNKLILLAMVSRRFRFVKMFASASSTYGLHPLMGNVSCFKPFFSSKQQRCPSSTAAYRSAENTLWTNRDPLENVGENARMAWPQTKCTNLCAWASDATYKINYLMIHLFVIVQLKASYYSGEIEQD